MAIGRAVNGRFLNCRAISQDNVIVKVDVVLNEGRGAALPTPHPKLSGVLAALKHHVAWPRDLIVVDKKVR